MQNYPYEIDAKLFSRKEIETLTRNCKGGYMSEHNLLKGKLEISEKDFVDGNDPFYKGGIAEFVK